jgi:hypothetical protein
VVLLPMVSGLALAQLSGEEEADSPPDNTLTMRAHRGWPKYEFVPEGVRASVAKDIAVYRIAHGRKKRIETLTDPSNDYNSALRFEEGRFHWTVEDVNFDGFLDVRFLADKSTSYFFLFDPKTGRFKLHRQLSELPNVDADRKRRVLVSHELHRFGYQEFRWRRGKLVLIKSVSDEDVLGTNRGS